MLLSFNIIFYFMSPLQLKNDWDVQFIIKFSQLRAAHFSYDQFLRMHLQSILYTRITMVTRIMCVSIAKPLIRDWPDILLSFNLAYILHI